MAEPFCRRVLTPPRGIGDAASYNTNLKQIQLRVQVHRFAHRKVIRGLRQVVQQNSSTTALPKTRPSILKFVNPIGR